MRDSDADGDHRLSLTGHLVSNEWSLQVLALEQCLCGVRISRLPHIEIEQPPQGHVHDVMYSSTITNHNKLNGSTHVTGKSHF